MFFAFSLSDVGRSPFFDPGVKKTKY